MSKNIKFSSYMKILPLIFIFLMAFIQNVRAELSAIECHLIEITRANQTNDVSHIGYHYDLIINLEENSVSKFIPIQKFFAANQRFDNMTITSKSDDQNSFNFERVSENNSYPDQTNKYYYSLTDNMKELTVKIIQFDKSKDKMVVDEYSRKYKCKKITKVAP